MDPISSLNKVLDNRVRFGVMSILMVNNSTSFNDLKQTLQVTDGNLSAHLQTLEESGFITMVKGYAGKKISTSYSVSKAGADAFIEHIERLTELIQRLR